MIIELTPEWRVRTDAMNWTLEHRIRKKDKDGNPDGWQWDHAGYYGSLEQCLIAIPDRVGRDLPETAQLHDLIARCRAVAEGGPINERLASDLEVLRQQHAIACEKVWELLADNVALQERLALEHCENGLLPDGPVCPRCGGKRAPSGVDGGTWVHLPGGEQR